MPRNGELSNEEKARSVLTRTGRPGNSAVAALTEDEHAELAKVYDECCAPELLLAERMDQFWGARQSRLDAAKATDDTQPATKADMFRNKPAPPQSAPSAPPATK